jgi:hypothetical protein
MELPVSLQLFSAASSLEAVVAVRSSETAALLAEVPATVEAAVVEETTTSPLASLCPELTAPVVVVVVDHEMHLWVKSF